MSNSKIFQRLLFIVSMYCWFGTINAAPIDAANIIYNKGDYTQAIKLYRSLAVQGDTWAQYKLGLMYANGKGVPYDIVKAYLWFNFAAVYGNADATKNRNIVAKKMTPQQAVEAQKIIRDCAAKKLKGCN